MSVKFSLLNFSQRIVDPAGNATREFWTFLINLFNATNGGTLGTAAFQNTGSSGANLPFLNGNNEWSGPQTFDSGDFILKGATSGTTKLVPAASAGGVITVPAATDTMVARNTNDTLTNKTIVSPVIVGTASGNNTLPLAMITPAVAVGQYPATVTNDNANAGNIGEFISSTVTSGAAVTVTNNTAVDITSTSLAAGNWLVSGNIGYTIAGGTFSGVQAWTSTTSASVPSSPSFGRTVVVATLASGTTIPTGIQRVTLTTSTTVYLTSFSSFAAGSATAYGYLEAWRPR